MRRLLDNAKRMLAKGKQQIDSLVESSKQQVLNLVESSKKLYRSLEKSVTRKYRKAKSFVESVLYRHTTLLYKAIFARVIVHLTADVIVAAICWLIAHLLH